ncbi:hypothetical protein GHT06_018001 [Daphnia sinensis]|uniref:BHLH domain-containing protein n=1 Tax=Daphnia sinensis TaxID=1820382 RepID=A0AAD5KLW0_9CRUS|nr:hypothetical protein GHT06_018001 [Daphnia sinensis]
METTDGPSAAIFKQKRKDKFCLHTQTTSSVLFQISAMSQSTKFNVLQPSFGHANNRLIPHQNSNSVDNLKAEASPLQRSTVRKSFKRKLPQQNLPVRDTCKAECKSPVSAQQPSFVDGPQSSAGRVGTKNSLGPHPPASVARRNARERNRVKQVNTGFAVLRQHIPVLCGSVIVYGGLPNSPEVSSSSSSSSSSSVSSPPASGRCKKNKMSKVETLRCAVEYIRNLEKLLATGGDAEVDQDQLAIKEEPLDCLSYELDVAVGSPSMQESRENISPFEIAGLSTSANDLSGFYDSSSSPESQSPDVHHQHNQRFLFPFLLDTSPTSLPPNGEAKRIKTEPDSDAAAFKQELLRSLSCWNRSDQEQQQPLPELLLDHPGQSELQQNSAMQNISDHSLLESLNSWWGSSL